MNANQPGFSKMSFAKTYLLPALLIFLVPILSLYFFQHAQHSFDSDARETILKDIQADATLTPEERDRAIQFFTETPFSKLIEDPEFAEMMDPDALFHYKMFRWMIWISAGSLLAGLGVFVLSGLCVLLSLTSLRAQFLSLSLGWQALRIYGALQTLAQGILLVALSFYVTALWMNFYSVKLILIAGILAVMAVGLVIKAIFTRPNMDFNISGKVIGRGESPALWQELGTICQKVGTELPDQVVLGIDDSFFVTESPIRVNDKTYRGRTLFVSLALLKQLNGAEADAVLAHEMAHFSGNDTVYSKKITPLINRYNNYLQALHQGGVTLPIFYFMNCFRAMYELSLGKLSRQREFRADKIAAETTSPRDMAAALLRIVAYSNYRNTVQDELFKQEQGLEAANVSHLIESGFQNYATSFASKDDLGDLETSHPFDSHPPIAQRLEAAGVELRSQDAEQLLASPGDGRWYRKIENSDQIERHQWDEFDEQFRNFHEASLAYRYLPETDAEHAVVVKWFPGVTFDGKAGPLVLDFEKLALPSWPAPIRYAEITTLVLNDDGTLLINYQRTGKHQDKIKTKKFNAPQQEVLDAINHYYSRFLSAVQYREEKNDK